MAQLAQSRRDPPTIAIAALALFEAAGWSQIAASISGVIGDPSWGVFNRYGEIRETTSSGDRPLTVTAQIPQMLLEILDTVTLGQIIGEFLKVAGPQVAVLPVYARPVPACFDFLNSHRVLVSGYHGWWDPCIDL